jgi:site-specific recombinase XerD/ribosomal protein L40E
MDDFANELKSNRGLKTPTVRSYVRALLYFGLFAVDKRHSSFKEVDSEDVKTYIKNPYPRTGHKKAPSTMNTTKIAFRVFYRWMKLENVTEGLKLVNPKVKQISPEDCISETEFTTMLNLCVKQRDRALLQLLMESGARVSEIINMTVRDIHFEPDSVYADIRTSKTQERKVYLFDATEDLKRWLVMHPFGSDPDAPLFISYGRVLPKKKKRMEYDAVRQMLTRLALRAGIHKRIHAHLFRHSRCSLDAKRGLPLPLAEKKYGWVKGSAMYSRYSHIRDTDVRDWDSQVRGLTNKKEEDKTEAKKCLRCGTMNSWTLTRCSVCGMALTPEALQEEHAKKAEQETLISQVLEKMQKMQEQLDAIRKPVTI